MKLHTFEELEPDLVSFLKRAAREGAAEAPIDFVWKLYDAAKGEPVNVPIWIGGRYKTVRVAFDPTNGTAARMG